MGDAVRDVDPGCGRLQRVLVADHGVVTEHPEQRSVDLRVVRKAGAVLVAEVGLLPEVDEVVPVRVGGRAGQRERRTDRDRLGVGCVHDRRGVVSNLARPGVGQHDSVVGGGPALGGLPGEAGHAGARGVHGHQLRHVDVRAVGPDHRGLVVEDDLEARLVGLRRRHVVDLVGVELVVAPLRDGDVAAGDCFHGSLDGRGVVVGERDRRGGAVEGQHESVTGAEVAERDGLHLDVGIGLGAVGVDLVDGAEREVGVGVRLQVVLPADAGVRHHRRAGARLDRGLRDVAAAGAEGSVEGVVSGELVADLVGDVVDGEEVALRLGQAGAAAALVVAADDAEVGDTAAVVAQRDVADVVVRGADRADRGRCGSCPASRRRSS